MPMTIRQIMAKTPPSRRNASQWVKISAIKVRKSPQGYPMVLAKTISGHSAQGVRKSPQPQHRYVTTIEVRNKHSIVSCSCDDFLFTWEVALAKNGAAQVEYSNGARPTDRNPSMIPGCCKHVYKLAESLIEQGKL